jgi:hypothetical protein
VSIKKTEPLFRVARRASIHYTVFSMQMCVLRKSLWDALGESHRIRGHAGKLTHRYRLKEFVMALAGINSMGIAALYTLRESFCALLIEEGEQSYAV